MMVCRILSGHKVIYWNLFFIMMVYREKGISNFVEDYEV